MKRDFRVLLTLALASCFAGCGNPRPPEPPALELPQQVRALRATRKGDHVTLSWSIPTKTTEAQTIRYLGPTRICRSLNAVLKECGTPVGEAAAPNLTVVRTAARQGTTQAATYVDSLPAMQAPPDENYYYAVEVMNENQRSAGLSNQVEVSAVATLAAPASFEARLSAEGVHLSWESMGGPPDTALLQHRYRIYRREQGGSDLAIADLPLGTTQFLDHSFDWEKTYSYRATVVSIVYPPASQNCASGEKNGEGCAPVVSVEGDDTPSVEVFTHDVFPPKVPSGLQAIFSEAGEQKFIDLIWAPNSETDLAGYNIFRREEGGTPVQMNHDLVKAPAYRDVDVRPGKKYFYTVSAVDVRGNQSAVSQEAAESVP